MPELTPNPGERLLVSRFANHTQGRLARGGRLILTDQRLVFRPHAFDRRLGGGAVELRREDVSDVDIAPRTGNPLQRRPPPPATRHTP